jgi:hypothetical protein
LFTANPTWPDWGSNRAAAVEIRRITAWAMALPVLDLVCRIHPPQVEGSCEHGNEPSVSINWATGGFSSRAQLHGVSQIFILIYVTILAFKASRRI